MRVLVVVALFTIFLIVGCAGANRHSYQQTLAPGTVLFSNFNPGDKADEYGGGWRVGGINRNTEEDASVEVGFLFSPTMSGRLKSIEMVMRSEPRTACTVIGTIRTDQNGPGKVLARFSFFVPSSASEELIAATMAQSLQIYSKKKYWIMLEPEDALRDSTFLYRRTNQPQTMIAIRHRPSGPWHVNGAYGAMLRMYTE